MELYSYAKYKGYDLYVEFTPLDDGGAIFEGTAKHNGTEIFTSRSSTSGDSAERELKKQIDDAA